MSEEEVLKLRCFYCGETVDGDLWHECNVGKLKNEFNKMEKDYKKEVNFLRDQINSYIESEEGYKTDIEIFKKRISDDGIKHKKEIDKLKKVIKNIKLKRSEMISW